MLKKIWEEKLKGLWEEVLGLVPDGKLGRGVFYVLLVLLAAAVGYSWIGHFLISL